MNTNAAKEGELFITGIDFDRRSYKDVDLLVNVRKEHTKIKDVINSFQQKVDKLIDKQRQVSLYSPYHISGDGNFIVNRNIFWHMRVMFKMFKKSYTV